MADKRGSRIGKVKHRDPPPPPPKYEPPNWAGKPPPGMHFDVFKGDKLLEKLIIEGKSHYLFGRLRDHVDFPLDHASCSRVHAVLVFHRHLKRMFVIDLGSTHGTFVGTVRVDAHQPVQVLVDSTLSFGASTRCFTLRERPNLQSALKMDSTSNKDDVDTGMRGLLGLPEEDTELDDLTEYNTAHNRRLGVNFEPTNAVVAKKRRRSSALHVGFREGEEIINPEDIDPTIGRFRNLVQTELVIPSKQTKLEPEQSMTESITKRMQNISYAQDLYSDIPLATEENHVAGAMSGQIMITSAPDVESPNALKTPFIAVNNEMGTNALVVKDSERDATEPRKKKYAKEAWPGKKPVTNLLSL